MAGRDIGTSQPPRLADGLLAGSRVLIAMPPCECRDLLARRVTRGGASILVADDAATGLEASRGGGFEAALVGGFTMPVALDLIASLSERRGVSCLLLTREPTMDDAVAGMQAGAIDVMPLDANPQQVVDRVAAGVARCRRVREAASRGDERATRLKKICRRLIASRREVVERSGEMCGEMARACRDLARQVDEARMTAEVGTLFRQELDLESLLRTALELLLKKTGPTNAAVFLPSTSGDYTLGAYANYDCSRDSVESVMEQLAGVISPAFETAEEPTVLATWPELNLALGQDAHLIDESTLAVVPCRNDDECLAVLAFFRDRAMPFDERLVRTLGLVGEVLGEQLARVIRTHHRHLPRDKWGGLGDQMAGDDDIDLAA